MRSQANPAALELWKLTEGILNYLTWSLQTQKAWVGEAEWLESWEMRMWGRQ